MMFDCTEEVRDYVEGQEVQRSISLNVEGIVDATMAEAPGSLDEALIIAEEILEEACALEVPRDESAFEEDLAMFYDPDLDE